MIIMVFQHYFCISHAIDSVDVLLERLT